MSTERAARKAAERLFKEFPAIAGYAPKDAVIGIIEDSSCQTVAPPPEQDVFSDRRTELERRMRQMAKEFAGGACESAITLVALPLLLRVLSDANLVERLKSGAAPAVSTPAIPYVTRATGRTIPDPAEQDLHDAAHEIARDLAIKFDWKDITRWSVEGDLRKSLAQFFQPAPSPPRQEKSWGFSGNIVVVPQGCSICGGEGHPDAVCPAAPSPQGESK